MTTGCNRITVTWLTPPDRGAIATLSIQGSGALLAIAPFLRARNGREVVLRPENRPIFARLFLNEIQGEEVVVYARSEHDVELHCHGSPFLVRRVIDSLRSQGIKESTLESWLRKEEADLIAVEARQALCRAYTFRTVQILADQYRGALTREVRGILALLGAGNKDSAKEEEAKERVDRLLARAEVGLHLTSPWRVALVGPPNAGKSSLFNCLVGYDRAIVDPMPGTTRDFVTAQVAIDGWPIGLVDTAGLCDPRDAIESEGVQRAQEIARTADLVVLVFDRSEPWQEEYAQWLGTWQNVLVVLNKKDLPARIGKHIEGLELSAFEPDTAEVLGRAIVARVVPQPPLSGEPVPFTSRQIELLRRTQCLIGAGHLAKARGSLCEVLGDDCHVENPHDT